MRIHVHCLSLIRTSQTEQIIIRAQCHVHYASRKSCHSFPLFFPKTQKQKLMISHAWFELGRHTHVEVYRGGTKYY